MADQNITALPVATTPESSDQLLLVGATEEKLIDYDKLADAILGKIASKNFALDQGNKTLLAALNELNSKRLCIQQVYGNGVWDDCNSIPIGETAVVFASAKNKPLGNDTWFIFCMGSVADKIKYQLAISYTMPFSVKVRTYDSANGNWLDWK